jgi:aryl-alcohol dehydrogenase-like predicted oxidoreductase
MPSNWFPDRYDELNRRHGSEGGTMDKRRIGTDGPVVSVVGLGCNNFGMLIDETASAAVVQAAVDAGISHFDTAEMYGGGQSEEFLGQALGARRDEVVIATKASPRPKDDKFVPGQLGRRIREACEGSLKRLGTDRIDLYYQHYPDAEATLDEALEALDSLKRDGKVLHIACSNYSGELLASAAAVSDTRHLASFCADQVPDATRLAVSIIPYFPLASGLLTGKYRRGEDFPAGSRLASAPYFAGVASEANLDYLDKLSAFAESHGHSILELAFGWLAAQDSVASIIAGATTPEQVNVNATAASWQLTTDELAALPTR